jgi:hypothetical protein
VLKKELLCCFALILMGALDWLTTVTGVLCFGAVEINPLFAALTKANVLVYSEIKLTIVVLVGVLFYNAGNIGKMVKDNSHLVKRFLESGYIVSLTALTVAVVNNVITVARAV